MKKKTPVHFYSDLYFMNFYFCPGWTREEMRSWFGVELEQHCYGIMIPLDTGIAIWIDKVEKTGGLVHECVHAANYLFEQKGIRISTKNDEAQAYLVQWIFDNCFPHCLKKSRRK